MGVVSAPPGRAIKELVVVGTPGVTAAIAGGSASCPGTTDG